MNQIVIVAFMVFTVFALGCVLFRRTPKRPAWLFYLVHVWVIALALNGIVAQLFGAPLFVIR